MNFKVVTTCHEKGWELYGRRMVESFDRFWPKDIPLAFYTQGYKPEPHGRLIIRELEDIKWLSTFKARHAFNVDANGKGKGSYDYQHDAIRFSHKVAAYTEEYFNCKLGDVLIWVDADTVTHAPVTTEWLESLVPKNFDLAWLSRHANYPECGFVMFKFGPACHTLMGAMTGLYITDYIFKLSQQHDSFLLEQMVKNLGDGIEVASLSGDGYTTHHPFVAGPLGARMDHLKGEQRKDMKKSVKANDRFPQRVEPYWQGAAHAN